MSKIQPVKFQAGSGNLLEKGKINSTKIQPTEHAKETKQNSESTYKVVGYVSSALALASIGVTTAIAVKNGKLTKELKHLSKGLKDAKASVKNVGVKVEDTETKLVGMIREGLEQQSQKTEGLGKWQDGVIGAMKEDFDNRISNIITSVKANGMGEILVSPTTINGVTLELGVPREGYGKFTSTIENALRSESTKRIFGLVDRSQIVPPQQIMIRVPTSEFRGFAKTGGMADVPQEVIANLGAMINKKQDVKLVVDTPLYMGQINNNSYTRIIRDGNGYKYIMSTPKEEKVLAELEKIDSMNLPIHTDNGKSNELVEVFMAKDRELEVDLNLLMPWLEKDLQKEISEAIKSGHPFDINTNILKVSYHPAEGKTKPEAKIKYDVVFYKNDKFDMSGPMFDGVDKTIYNDKVQNSRETERFIYFDKFFYEHLLRNEQNSTVPLRADLIIGNDWQTGGISAMIRLLTTVKKYFGLDPKIADKIYSTPIMTIMHNAGLMGESWHSQAKLLNIMFGEHASIITKNAWMPKEAHLNPDSLNGLLHGTNINPQTMAVAYSDVVTPVSKGYGSEMANHSGFGSKNHDIYRMRGRYHEFSDINTIKQIAKANGIDESLVNNTSVAYRPITNGSDRVNNMLTKAKARELEAKFGFEKGSIWTYKDGEDFLNFHNHNKEIYLNKIIEDINLARQTGGKQNPLNVYMPELTDLTGVTKDTMVVTTAGRVSDQKGFEIWAESIEEFLSRHAGEKNLPVFYAQGSGDMQFLERLWAVKKRVAERYGNEAANRIVFAGVFDPNRYLGCQIMSDFNAMPSWFEPCGLVHKQTAGVSGAIPLINRVGGLPEGLEDGVNAIVSNFKNKYENFDEALKYNRKAFADAIDRCYSLFNNKDALNKTMEKSFKLDHSWLKNGGAMQEYAQTFVDLKVLNPEVLKVS